MGKGCLNCSSVGLLLGVWRHTWLALRLRALFADWIITSRPTWHWCQIIQSSPDFGDIWYAVLLVNWVCSQHYGIVCTQPFYSFWKLTLVLVVVINTDSPLSRHVTDFWNSFFFFFFLYERVVQQLWEKSSNCVWNIKRPVIRKTMSDSYLNSSRVSFKCRNWVWF